MYHPRTLTASWSGQEIDVTFMADSSRNDYGVPGSPVWFEPENVRIKSLSVLGVETDPDKLPDPIKVAILEISNNDIEWQDADS